MGLASLAASILCLALVPSCAFAQELGIALEGGAQRGPDEAIKADVLTFDGQEGSYAHCPVPEGFDNLRNFRIEMKFRLDQPRASSIPIARPGSFMIYIDGNCRPWFMFFHEKGRSIIASPDPIVPTTWNISPRDADGRPGAVEKMLIGTRIQDRDNPMEMARIVRSTDPCMACSVH